MRLTVLLATLGAALLLAAPASAAPSWLAPGSRARSRPPRSRPGGSRSAPTAPRSRPGRRPEEARRCCRSPAARPAAGSPHRSPSAARPAPRTSGSASTAPAMRRSCSAGRPDSRPGLAGRGRRAGRADVVRGRRLARAGRGSRRDRRRDLAGGSGVHDARASAPRSGPARAGDSAHRPRSPTSGTARARSPDCRSTSATAGTPPWSGRARRWFPTSAGRGERARPDGAFANLGTSISDSVAPAPSTEPAVAVSPTGRSTALWTDSGQVKYAEHAPGEPLWSAETRLSQLGTTAAGRRRSVRHGRVHRRLGSDTAIATAARAAGGAAFAGFQTISGPSMNPSLPQVAAGGNGDALISWSLGDGKAIPTVQRKANGAFGPILNAISAANPVQSFFAPSIGIDDQGNGVAAWTRDEFRSHELLPLPGRELRRGGARAHLERAARREGRCRAPRWPPPRATASRRCR